MTAMSIFYCSFQIESHLQIASNDVKVSVMTPRGETEDGAMEFPYWKAMGLEFLVKSNINNWIKCSPAG